MNTLLKLAGTRYWNAVDLIGVAVFWALIDTEYLVGAWLALVACAFVSVAVEHFGGKKP